MGAVQPPPGFQKGQRVEVGGKAGTIHVPVMNKSDQSYTYFVSFDGEDESVKVPAADISSAELREVE